MDFEDYQIIEIKPEGEEAFILKLKPRNSNQIFSFLPGQFAQIKNPKFEKPDECHLFSIASSPDNKDYLEFCIKTYGFWTQALSKLKVEDTLKVKGPFGKFVFDLSLTNIVFLIGGVGITPVMSMLRHIDGKKLEGNFVLLYGNRDEKSIAYKNELEDLSSKIKALKVVNVLSELDPSSNWKGYKGFITSDLIQKEVNLESKPTFFLCGPPIFIQKMKEALKQLNVSEEKIKIELF